MKRLFADDTLIFSTIVSYNDAAKLHSDLTALQEWAQKWQIKFKVARYSFSGSIPPKFEHKLRRQKQSLGKSATTVVLDEDEN